jgi:hypothetical protein
MRAGCFSIQRQLLHKLAHMSTRTHIGQIFIIEPLLTSPFLHY